MSRRTRLLAIILGAAAAIVVIAGVLIYQQRWREADRVAFIDSCVNSCRASPGVTEDRYAQCDQACKCGAEEAEKIVSRPELLELVAAMQDRKASKEQNEKLEKIKAAGIACAAQATKK